MKFLLPLLFATATTMTMATDPVVISPKLESKFLQWMQTHDKTYENTKEMLYRMQIWVDNHAYIQQHNHQQSPKPSYMLGHNQFSDLTVTEYQAYNKLGASSPGLLSPRLVKSFPQQQEKESTIKTPLPDQVNWVNDGAVLPVKNQGMCGSCWAFSAICAIEGAHYVDTGTLIGLSEQELIDCDPLDLGCGGGLMDNAFMFDENTTGICSEDDYPYAGHKRWFRGCAATKGVCDGIPHTRVASFVDVTNTVDALKAAIAQQPVSVAIEADTRSFQLYRSGVYDDADCGTDLDHGVAAVGYGTSEEGLDYFLVRNSWGPTWGDAGYIKMAQISTTVNGTCGILGFASRPVLRDD